MYISQEDKNQILDRSSNKLLDVISEHITLIKKGSAYLGKCPMCSNPEGLTIHPNKGVFKCFKCNGISGKTPVDYLMKGENLSFPDALEYLARHVGYIIHEPDVKQPAKKEVKKTANQSFCARMLAESGLTKKDVTAKVYRKDENSTVFEHATFMSGTITNKHEAELNGDDALITYYDLEGLPVVYEQKDAKGRPTGKMKEYFRVRYQFPEEHLDKAGKPTKYKSPYGAGSYIYIPQVVRSIYKEGTKIDRLFIQEGEKKAEKASKHGFPSVAISGIQNLGSQGRLPEDIIKIIDKCQVKEVVFLLDSDWNDITSNIKINDSVEKRPRNFFYAVKNFKEYFRTLKNRQIYVEIYFGHINKNNAGDKGIDDLLANSLKDKEEELLSDFNTLINEKNMIGKWMSVYKITSVTDLKLEEYWRLNNPQAFAEYHKETLQHLPEFKIGRHIWKFDEQGQFVSATPIDSEEQYWSEVEKTDRSGNTYKQYGFNYHRCFRFLQSRGFGRYRKLDGSFCLVHLEPPTVKIVEHTDIRDYITDFTKSVANEDVLNMLYRGGPQFLGPDKLSNLDYIYPNFDKPSRDQQLLFFDSTLWEINQFGIKELDYTKVSNHIWHNKKKEFCARKLGDLIHIDKHPSTGKFSYTVTSLGKGCHFLQFLENTSNFTWRKQQRLNNGEVGVDLTDEELYANVEHMVSKMCAIGFMLMEHKDRSVSKAIIAMDGKQSEVGASNGRSGKSIVGELFKRCITTVYLNGKTKDMTADAFLWNDVMEDTRCVFIDDIRPNFDFEFLFANITGDWKVNYKGGGRATFPFNISPKIYLTTNHAINGEGSSFQDRQWLIAFSDFYNDKHKPIDDFGVMFFDEWDSEQWNLMWNFLATCIQTYLRFGVVEAPGERLETRRLRQQIGEEFIMWADEYFSNEEKINERIPRKELYDTFLEYSPDQRKYTKPQNFKKKFKFYCEFKGYIFNPSRFDPISGEPMFFDADGNPDLDDKSNGCEYFSIAIPKEIANADIDVNHLPFK